MVNARHTPVHSATTRCTLHFTCRRTCRYPTEMIYAYVALLLQIIISSFTASTVDASASTVDALHTVAIQVIVL